MIVVFIEKHDLEPLPLELLYGIQPAKPATDHDHPGLPYVRDIECECLFHSRKREKTMP
jgi:hypothetical protein